jgi:chaperone modulatory protein CbpM
MDDRKPSALRGSVVEEELTLTTIELCRAAGASESHLAVWVAEGVLKPSAGGSPPEWRFGGASLRRIRVATRLARDLEVNPPGVALALDLLDEIEALEARLRRVSERLLRP